MKRKILILGFVPIISIILYLSAKTILRKYDLNDFSGGVNTKISPHILPDNQTEYAQNVLFDETLGIKSRADLYGTLEISSYPVANKHILKMWEYKKSNGSRYLIAQAEDELYATSDKKTWVKIKDNIDWQASRLNATVYDDKMFFCNGMNYNFVWTGSLTEDSTEDIEWMPRTYYITSHNNMLIIAGTLDNHNILYYNLIGYDPLEENSWNEATQYITIGNKNGDDITGLYSYNGNLIIFKEHTIWALIGYSYDDWQLIQIDNQYGCLYQESITTDKGVLKWLSSEGIIAFDGGNVFKIDYPIENLTKNSNNTSSKVGYLQITDTDDFETGTSTNIETNENKLTLSNEVESATWEDFDNSMGTYTYTTSKGGNIILKETYYPQGLALVTPEEKNRGSYSFSDYISIKTVDYGADNFAQIVRYGGRSQYNHLFTLYARGGYRRTLSWGGFHNDYYDDDADSKRIIYDYSGWIEEKNWQSINGTNSFDYDIITYDFGETKDITKLYIKGKMDLLKKVYTDDRNDVRLSENHHSWKIKIILCTPYKTTQNTEEWAEIYTHTMDAYFNTEGDPYFATSAFPGTEETKNFEILLSTETTFIMGTVERLKIKLKIEPDISFVYDTDWESETRNMELWLQIKSLRLSEIKLYEDREGYLLVNDTGTFISNVYDFNQKVILAEPEISDAITSPATAQYYIQYSTDNINWSSWTQIYDEQNINQEAKYIKWKAYFETPIDSFTTVMLDEFKLNAYHSSGTWISQNYNISEINTYKYFITDDDTNNKTINYYIKIATSSSSLNSKSWTQINSGDLIPNKITGLTSNDKWIKFKVYMETNDSDYIPETNSIFINYVINNDQIIPTAQSINDRYWIALSTGNDNYNNIILVNDKRNNWTIFTGLNVNCITKYDDNYYIALADQYKILKIGEYPTDNGNPILATWEKTLNFGTPHRDKHIKTIYLNCKKVSSGIIQFGYNIENDTTTYYLSNIDISGTGELSEKRNIPNHSGVRYFKTIIKSTAPIEIHNIRFIIEEEDIR